MASGDTLWTFFPADIRGGTTATRTTRNSHSILNFITSAVTTAIFEAVLVRNYAGGGIDAVVGWSSESSVTASEQVRWSVSFERVGHAVLDIDADSFASAQAATATPESTLGMLDHTEIAFTDGAQVDSIAIGEKYRVKLERITTHVDDDMPDNAEMHFLELREN